MIADKQAFWTKHWSAWKESGLTQRVYCAAEGINFHNFVYHRHRVSDKSQKMVMNFVEATPELASSNRQTPALQLMLPNGVRIGITNDINPTLLQTIMVSVGGQAC